MIINNIINTVINFVNHNELSDVKGSVKAFNGEKKLLEIVIGVYRFYDMPT